MKNFKTATMKDMCEHVDRVERTKKIIRDLGTTWDHRHQLMVKYLPSKPNTLKLTLPITIGDLMELIGE